MVVQFFHCTANKRSQSKFGKRAFTSKQKPNTNVDGFDIMNEMEMVMLHMHTNWFLILEISANQSMNFYTINSVCCCCNVGTNNTGVDGRRGFGRSIYMSVSGPLWIQYYVYMRAVLASNNRFRLHNHNCWQTGDICCYSIISYNTMVAEYETRALERRRFDALYFILPFICTYHSRFVILFSRHSQRNE